MFYGKNRGIEQYRRNQILTADKSELVNMLYKGSIRFLKTSIDAIKDKKFDLANKGLVRVQKILMELMLSLNPEANEIAKNLYALYGFMHRRLIEANVKKDIEIVEEVKGFFEELQKTWEEAMEKEKENRRQQMRPTGLNIVG